MELNINQEILRRYGVRIYQATAEQDLYLLRLWIYLTETEDIKELFLPATQNLTGFLQKFQMPALSVYTLDESNQIDFIVWFTPFEIAIPSAFVGLWSHKKLRGSRKLIELIGTLYSGAFTLWQQLFGITRQKLIAQHQKMGYSVIGTIPGFYEDEAGINVVLNTSNFEASKVFKIYQRLLKG